MLERRPKTSFRAAICGWLTVAFLLHVRIHIATGGNSWRSFISQTPITQAWWADAILQLLAFGLQLAATVYIWLPHGYSIDQKKTLLVETVGLPWMLQWGSLVAADLAHLVLGTGPLALTTTSLLSSIAGFAALYGGLRRLHPLMMRLAQVDKAMKYRRSIIRTGTRWSTAYYLFRLPTSVNAGLCAARAAADAAALGMAATGTPLRDAVNASLAVLLLMMVLGIVMLHHLDELAFSLTVVAWLFGLILATHTSLMVKCFAIALNFALGMRAAFKYLDDDEGEQKGK